MHWLWRRSSPSPPARWWPCGVCRRGRAASERRSWAAGPTRGWERARRKTRRRTTTWGTPADSCRGGSGRRRWPAPCSVEQKGGDFKGVSGGGAEKCSQSCWIKEVWSLKTTPKDCESKTSCYGNTFYLSQYENNRPRLRREQLIHSEPATARCIQMPCVICHITFSRKKWLPPTFVGKKPEGAITANVLLSAPSKDMMTTWSWRERHDSRQVNKKGKHHSEVLCNLLVLGRVLIVVAGWAWVKVWIFQ